MLKEFFNNTRKPQGLGGKIMLSMMNFGHSSMAKWGMSHIRIKDNFTILDIGCGGGKNIKIWLDKVPKGTVRGIDYSAESVKKSIAVNKKAISEGRCEIIEASVNDMPFEKDTFDLVSAFETVYFWQNIQDAFQSVYDVLKEGGNFIIVNEACDDRADKWTDIISGMRVYRREELVELLENVGFTISIADVKKSKGWLVIVAKK